MDDPRKITEAYLQLFVETITKGGKVIFVKESNLLAVDHPSQGYLVLQIADKVVDSVEEKDITSAS